MVSMNSEGDGQEPRPSGEAVLLMHQEKEKPKKEICVSSGGGGGGGGGNPPSSSRPPAPSHNAMHNVWLWGVDSEADHSRVTARENRGARFHRSVDALIKSS